MAHALLMRRRMMRAALLPSISFSFAVVLAACGGATMASSSEPSASSDAPAPTATPAAPPAVANPGSTIPFAARSVTADRRTQTTPCDSASAFSRSDLFSLSVDGAATGPVAPSALVVVFDGAASPGAGPVALVPSTPDASGMQTAASPAAGVRHAVTLQVLGAAPAAFTGASVEVVAFPARDADPLTVRVVVRYPGGATLDQTFSAALAPFGGGCAAGG